MKNCLYIFALVFFFTIPLSQALNFSEEDRVALGVLKAAQRKIQETVDSGVPCQEPRPPFRNRLSEIENPQSHLNIVAPGQIQSALEFDFPELKKREAALYRTSESIQAFNEGPLKSRQRNGEGLRFRSVEDYAITRLYLSNLDTHVKALHRILDPLRLVFINYFDQLSALHTFVNLDSNEYRQQLRCIVDIQSPELQEWFDRKMVEPSKKHIKKAQGNILTNYVRLMVFTETAYCLFEKGLYLWYKMLGQYAQKYAELGDGSLLEEYKKIKFELSNSEEK